MRASPSSGQTDFVSVYVTAPDDDVAKSLARRLLKEHLIACANLFPTTSLYRWEGNEEESREVVMFMKTRRDLAQLVVREVERHHPYETPCVVVFDLEGGSSRYLSWIRGETASVPGSE